MDWSRTRFPLALLVGIFLSTFGVFIFGKFTYYGLNLNDNVFKLMGDLETAAVGFYQLFGSGFHVDLFTQFSAANLEGTTSGAIFMGELVWPCVISWITTGFVIGAIVKGPKRGFYLSLITLVLVFLLWVICGFFAGEDMASIYQDHFATRMSELFTGFIFTIPTATLAGAITGPFD